MAYHAAVAKQQKRQRDEDVFALDTHEHCSLAGMAVNMGLAQAESMDMTNDPRFFSKNIMDKRLSAFKQLTIVSSLMFGTSLGQTFKLKKDMDFSHHDPYVGCIAYWQFAGFVISLVVSVMCLISLYVIAHQLFYTYRLMTAGPTGFEQASVFYLTKVIVMWRHFAIKCLFNGLTLFIFLIGVQLFVKFYKDADGEVKQKHVVYAVNLQNGTSVDHLIADLHAQPKLNMGLHAMLAYGILVLYFSATLFLWYVRQLHLQAFVMNYKDVKQMTAPIEQTMRAMSVRSKNNLDV